MAEPTIEQQIELQLLQFINQAMAQGEKYRDIITSFNESRTVVHVDIHTSRPPSTRACHAGRTAPYIQQYDATRDPPVLVRTHDGWSGVTHALPGVTEHQVRSAVDRRAELAGHRWMTLPRTEAPDTVQALPPAFQDTSRKTGVIARLDPTTGSIIDLHADQTSATLASGLKNSASINLAINRGMMAAGHRWARYAELPLDVRAAYAGPMPAPRKRTCSKAVAQVHPGTGETVRTWPTLTDAYTHVGGCHKGMVAALRSGGTYREFVWREVEVQDIPDISIGRKE